MLSKMHILIKSRVTIPPILEIYADDPEPRDADIDVGHAVNTAAHAGAMIQFKFPRISSHWEGMGGQGGGDRVDVEDPVMADWYDNSFRKVCCKVTEVEFEKAKTYFPKDEWFVVTESAFGNAEVALVFKPRKDWPPFFKSLKLYK